MVILFVTTQEKVCRKLASLISCYGHIVQVYTDPRQFYEVVKASGPQKIDLIGCDYTMFDWDCIDPFAIMAERKCVIPFFFYNSPFPQPEERAFHWFEKIRLRQGTQLRPGLLDMLLPELVRIQEALNSPAIQPYVKLLNAPEELPDEADELVRDFDLETFCREHRVQTSRAGVLRYLYEHRNEELEEEAICEYVWKSSAPEKIHTLYSYIHDLRKACREEKKFYVSIERTAKKTYCLVVKKSGEEQRFATAREFLEKRKRIPITFQTADASYMQQFQKQAPNSAN